MNWQDNFMNEARVKKGWTDWSKNNPNFINHPITRKRTGGKIGNFLKSKHQKNKNNQEQCLFPNLPKTMMAIYIERIGDLTLKHVKFNGMPRVVRIFAHILTSLCISSDYLKEDGTTRIPTQLFNDLRTASGKKPKEWRALKKEIREAIEHLKYKTKIGIGSERLPFIGILKGTNYVNKDEIVLEIDEAFIALVKTSKYTPINPIAYSFSSKPNLFSLYDCLNDYRHNNKNHSHIDFNITCLGVKVIIDNLEDMPTVEEVKNQRQSLLKKIITPLEACLKDLWEVGTYSFCWAGKEHQDLTDIEIMNIKKIFCDDAKFSKLQIKFRWKIADKIEKKIPQEQGSLI